MPRRRSSSDPSAIGTRQHKLSRWRRACAVAASTAVLGSGLMACGGDAPQAQQPTQEQTGPTTYKLGAPKDTRYMADIEAQRGRIRVIVRRQSRCDVIPVRTIVENGATRWEAGRPTESKPCEEGVARNVVISLEVAGNTYRLGEPNAFGELQTQLSDRLMRDLYDQDKTAVPVAQVMLRDRTGQSHLIGSVALTQLAEAEQRLDQLLEEFRMLLDRPQAQLSGTDLARAYELYEQLSAFDSQNPRIGALQALFIDRLYQRKADEAAERFKNNLQALSAAKDVLKNNQTVLVIPSFVSSAVNGGALDARTVAWARAEVALTLRRQRALCGDAQSAFTWSMASLSPPQSQLAFHILRSAYDDPYQDQIRSLCQRVVM